MAYVRSTIGSSGGGYLTELEQKVDAAVLRAMKRTGLVGEARVKSIFENEAYDTGRALRSINSKVLTENAAIRLLIGSNLQYVYDIEYGRKPGKFPNLDALVAWCGRKLRRQGVNARVNVSYDALKELARSGGKPATAQQKAARQQLAMVYLVGRKIATKGIREKLIFRRIQDGLLAYFRQEVSKELKSLR